MSYYTSIYKYVLFVTANDTTNKTIMPNCNRVICMLRYECELISLKYHTWLLFKYIFPYVFNKSLEVKEVHKVIFYNYDKKRKKLNFSSGAIR